MSTILSQIFRGEYTGGAHRYKSGSEVEIAFKEAEEMERSFNEKDFNFKSDDNSVEKSRHQK